VAEFRMPALGADMDEETLIEWLVKPGDEVHKGDIIAVVDTAKSAIEVESFHSGTIKQLIVQPGETVPVGAVLATLTATAAKARPAEAPAKRPAALPAAARPPKPAAAKPAGKTGPASSPLVRHVAQELGIDLATVQGTGRAGAITRADVERAAASRHRRATPLARRIAADLGVDLAAVTGTGRGGAVRCGKMMCAGPPARSASRNGPV
jgi:pyruvate dehydrogenase E2 component (dihydrolipoamide acetyltransferase)